MTQKRVAALIENDDSTLVRLYEYINDVAQWGVSIVTIPLTNIESIFQYDNVVVFGKGSMVGYANVDSELSYWTIVDGVSNHGVFNDQFCFSSNGEFFQVDPHRELKYVSYVGKMFDNGNMFRYSSDVSGDLVTVFLVYYNNRVAYVDSVNCGIFDIHETIAPPNSRVKILDTDSGSPITIVVDENSTKRLLAMSFSDHHDSLKYSVVKIPINADIDFNNISVEWGYHHVTVADDNGNVEKIRIDFGKFLHE